MDVSNLKKPLAIAMWDSSWLRRRYAGGGFESFDQALDELVERGYNAVRIDASPHLIAKDVYGNIRESFFDPPGVAWQRYGFASWGNQWTVHTHPRKDIVEFIKKCEKRNVQVALSTWLKPTLEATHEQVCGAKELIRIWDETLSYLQDNDCLNNILYVDILNEYPFGASFPWLLNCIRNEKHPKEANKSYNSHQMALFQSFADEVIKTLKGNWKNISFAASLDTHLDLDYSNFDFIDFHQWVSHNEAFEKALNEAGYKEILNFGKASYLYKEDYPIPYGQAARLIPGDINFEKINEKIKDEWQKFRPYCIEWLEEEFAYACDLGKRYGIPIGSTEGCGLLSWFEHPLLDWELIKDCGEIGAKLGAKYGYSFNCQSNECEPQFIRLWRDVEYHQKVTKIIKSGSIKKI